MPLTISVDTGGTFTDIVVVDDGGDLTLGKALTTPQRAFEGMRNALEAAAAERNTTLDKLLQRTSLFIYGTTRATNAIVESSTARTAFLTTEGFPDVLVLKEGGKLHPHQLDIDYPQPYIPRSLTFECPERLSSEGEVLAPLDERRIREIVAGLDGLGVEAVGVCLLWSVVNPAHEARIGEIIAEMRPDLHVTLSHRLNPVLREYRRSSSTAIDASLKPLMQRHLRDMEADLRAAGYAGELVVATSFGGVMHVEDVIDSPIFLVRSGPAMAPIAGITYAELEQAGKNLIVCDAGGTTFDVSLVRDGVPVFTRDTWLGGAWTGHCTGLSSVDVRSYGAGGGSIAWIDSGGLLQVGPHSAGSVPGPACYGRGGIQPTVTDAAAVLGFLDPANFLGGKMALDLSAARKAVDPIANQLRLSCEDAAFAIMTLANEHMIAAIKEITINEGLDPSESVILAGGGAGGLNILPIARELGCHQIILPRTAGALSACGAQFSDIVAEFNASAFTNSNKFDATLVNLTLADLQAKAAAFAEQLVGRGLRSTRTELTVEARYLSQVWELDVSVPGSAITSEVEVAALVEGFHRVHQRVFAVCDRGQPVEFLNWKVRLVAELNRPDLQLATKQSERECLRGYKKAWFGPAGELDTAVWRGADLATGAVVEGPALIAEPTTTLVVYPGTRATVSAHGNYLLQFEEEGEAVESSSAKMSNSISPMLTAILANRLDAIVREMSNTLLRAARSAVINMGRDFSCVICTGDNQLLSTAEGLPVHIFGMHLQTASMCQLHPDLREGDAFLHNDPYLGNSHPADHTILVPVFVDGEHMFTTCAKAHQADIGNSKPTTYVGDARDVYEEGAIIFPCVLTQRDNRDVADVIRMCRSRIRVPDQWFGDYLAAVGAARVGERRLKELVAKYGKGRIKAFIKEWFDYSERRMANAIAKLPAGVLSRSGRHDPIRPIVTEGVPINVKLEIDPAQAKIVVDLRDNVDCVDCGLNQTMATAINNAVTGVFNCVDYDIPHNSGSLRRVEVLLRENCVVGIPRFPHSCSMATTNIAHWLVNLTQAAFADLADGYGLAEGGGAMSLGMAVVSGKDWRRQGAPYVNQLILAVNGGPASPRSDGWVTYALPGVGGVQYRDSIELDELKHPMLIRSLRLIPDSGGPGKFRGAPGCEIIIGTRRDPMSVVIPCDMQENPPRGVRGGSAGSPAGTWKVAVDGSETKLDNFVTVVLKPGELLRGTDNGGGGYGDPLERDLGRITHDLREGWITAGHAREAYGVVFDDAGALDRDATTHRRAILARAAAPLPS
jgi:N-methylhydantoinase A/oxoprolinase/acetone carboxylase beta subunit/N-methylhydantoinase B/oxoprolinase/acetone carboxylase alpha subunit